jgi:hypothetical protein
VEPDDPFRQVARNRRRQELGPGVHGVDDGQLDDLGPI